MKHAMLVAVAATFALGACGKSGDPAAEASASPTQEAPPVPKSASKDTVPFTPGQAPSKPFVVGTWGEGADCVKPVKFQADGTIDHGPFPTWDLRDGILTMKGAKNRMKLKVVDEKTMELQIEKEKPVRLRRC